MQTIKALKVSVTLRDNTTRIYYVSSFEELNPIQSEFKTLKARKVTLRY